MIFTVLKEMWFELTEYCVKNPIFSSDLKNQKKHSNPPFLWFVEEAIKILQAYPKGISRPVLLTELESKW